MRFKDFIIVKSAEEAVSVSMELGKEGFIMAGGTSTTYIADNSEKIAIDITRAGLSGIEKKDGGFRIGATTKIDEIARFNMDGWVLSEPAWRLATQQIRNISTIGGNISRVFWWSDFPVVLLALDAKIEIKDSCASGGKTEMNALDFFFTQPVKILKPGKIITSIWVPAVGGDCGFGYAKKTKTSPGFTICTTASMITLKEGEFEEVKVAIGGVFPFPRRLIELEKVLKGKKCNRNEVEGVVKNVVSTLKCAGREGMSSEYSAHLLSVTITDSIFMAVERAGDGKNERC